MSAFDNLNEQETRAAYELAARGNRSLQQVADDIGIQRRVLYRLRKRPHVKKAIRELVAEEIDEALPEAIGALRKQAVKGNVKAVELLGKMSGLLIERQMIHQHTTSDDGAGRFKELSESQIDEELKALGMDTKDIVDEQ